MIEWREFWQNDDMVGISEGGTGKGCKKSSPRSMSSDALRPHLHEPSIRSPLLEKVVYVSIGCSVESSSSLDQQLPLGLEKYCLPGSLPAKLWLFDPKFWNCLPFALRSPTGRKSPTIGAKECLSDLDEHYSQLGPNLYLRGGLQIEVCPFYFERQARFFQPFIAYLNEILSDGGYVYISVFTQPYLKVEENQDVIALYHSLVDEMAEHHHEALTRLFYHHLAEYGTALADGNTLVWKLENGKKHDQDEALLREVSRFPGESPTFGCGCYAAFAGTLFSIDKIDTGHDYEGLHAQVKAEVARRGGAEQILQSPQDVQLNQIQFP